MIRLYDFDEVRPEEILNRDIRAQPVSWLLMPATVSLAIPLYEKWELLEKNLAALLQKFSHFCAPFRPRISARPCP